MTERDLGHCRIVSESLNGQRGIDEHTFAALAILHERLERLKELDDSFSGVTFSPEAKKLQNQANAVPIG
jgi:hypothetical protein